MQWVNELQGDFSFKEKWDYDIGISKNEFGQLDCNGCFSDPERLDKMKDADGRILKDSLNEFYKIVDTTHFFHSIQCEAWCYEWAGTDYLFVYKLKNGQIEALTTCSPATHCSLHLDFSGDTCKPMIALNSIIEGGDATYHLTGGYIKIDKQQWKKGIMKAEFSFDFYNPEPSDQKMFWKGRIFSEIGSSRHE